MSDTPRSDGYSRLSIFAHWLAAIIVIALFATHEADDGGIQYFIHVSLGGVAGLFLLWRVWHRVKNGMTDKPDQPALLNLASQVVIWGLLAAIAVVVLTGYLLPWSLGKPIDLLGLLFIPSPLPASHDFHEFVEEIHETAGHLFLPLVGLHVLGAAKHALIDRDGIARRMLRSVTAGR